MKSGKDFCREKAADADIELQFIFISMSFCVENLPRCNINLVGRGSLFREIELHPRTCYSALH